MLNKNQLNKIFSAEMSDAEFNKLSKFIFEVYGIKMPIVKKVMLQSRLQKRLRELQITSYKDYIDYVFSQQGENEVIHMMDVVSTNKTDFFRESTHFDFLSREIIKKEHVPKNTRNILKIWSAGCSSGEEPYTLAMVLADFGDENPMFDFQILATDISTRMLETAAKAIYSEEKVEIVPMALKKKFLLRSKDRALKTIRIVPALRSKISFKRLNLIDPVYDVHDTFDIVFCRNVLIYFDRPTQEKVINKLCSHLKPGGYFFLGHSESVTGMQVPLKQIKPTIFTKI